VPSSGEISAGTGYCFGVGDGVGVLVGLGGITVALGDGVGDGDRTGLGVDVGGCVALVVTVGLTVGLEDGEGDRAARGDGEEVIVAWRVGVPPAVGVDAGENSRLGTWRAICSLTEFSDPTGPVHDALSTPPASSRRVEGRVLIPYVRSTAPAVSTREVKLYPLSLM
jgi:hypothetical protein